MTSSSTRASRRQPTLTAPLRKTAQEVKAAHAAVLGARDQHKKLAHKRNLATLVLVRHHGRKVQPTLRAAGIGRHNWAEILPKSPATLPQWTPEEADRIVADTVEEIAKLAAQETEASEARVRGLRTLADATEEGEPLFTKVEIADLVGMSEVLVGRYLAQSEDTAAADTEEGLEPIAVLADRLGVPLKRILDRIEYARKNDIAVPRTSPGRGRMVMVDVPAFVQWWEDNRFHWLSAQELADRWGMPVPHVRARLRTAKDKGTEPESVNFGRLIYYNPQAADDWGAQHGYAPRQ